MHFESESGAGEDIILELVECMISADEPELYSAKDVIFRRKFLQLTEAEGVRIWSSKHNISDHFALKHLLKLKKNYLVISATNISKRSET